MDGNGNGSVDRLYPIGALSQRDVADLRLDPLCVDSVDIDSLMQEWRAKSLKLRSELRPLLASADSDILPLNVSPEVKAKIDKLVAAYRSFLPAIYELGMVPLAKLVSPQKHVDVDYAKAAFDGISRKLTDDEVASYCLATPIRDAAIDASFLGYPKGPSGEFSYLYQFSSDDQNVRYIPAVPLKPLQDLDVSDDGGEARYDVKAIAVMVGPGTSFVHVLKVPVGLDTSTGKTVYRLIISNGIHRLSRLYELGNTHAAALIQQVDIREVPDPFIETKRESLFGADALRLTELVDPSLTRVLKWKRTKRVIKLQINVQQDISFVP